MVQHNNKHDRYIACVCVCVVCDYVCGECVNPSVGCMGCTVLLMMVADYYFMFCLVWLANRALMGRLASEAQLYSFETWLHTHTSTHAPIPSWCWDAGQNTRFSYKRAPSTPSTGRIHSQRSVRVHTHIGICWLRCIWSNACNTGQCAQLLGWRKCIWTSKKTQTKTPLFRRSVCQSHKMHDINYNTLAFSGFIHTRTNTHNNTFSVYCAYAYAHCMCIEFGHTVHIGTDCWQKHFRALILHCALSQICLWSIIDGAQ